MKNKSTCLLLQLKFVFTLLFFVGTISETNAQGNALSFDGTNDYIVIGPAGGLYTAGHAYTKEAWIFSDDYYSARNIISSQDPFYIEANNKVYAINDYIIPNQEHFDVYDPVNMSAKRWVHYAVTYDGVSTLKLYRNGILANTGSSSPYTSTATQNYIGAFFDQEAGQLGYFYNGKIDQVRIYNTELTQANIQADMVSTTASVPGSLVAYYNFNSGTAGGNNTAITTLTDNSGHGYTGALHNFTLTGTSSNFVGSYAMIIPAANSATGITNTTFTANWTTPVFGSGFIDRYHVHVASDPDFSAPIAGSPFTVPFGTNTKTITGLTGNTNYYYRVSADKTGFDDEGALSNIISLTTLVTLPVNSLTFNVSKATGGNLLQWSTGAEQNTRHFEVERSTTGADFKAIATVTAAGTSTTLRSYQYADNLTQSQVPVYYYRLKMTDLNGNFSYSDILLIKNTKGGTVTVYPNPAQDKVVLNITDKSLLKTTAVLSDISGRQLQKIQITQTVTNINISTYERGIYVLRLANGESITLIKE